MAPIDPQDTKEAGIPRRLLVVFGLAALTLAGALLFWGYQRIRGDRAGDEAATILQSIPAFDGTAESGVAPLHNDFEHLPEAGSVAPDFELLDINGETVRLSDYLGRPVILNFWATWCAPCRVEMPDLQRAQDEFGDDGPQVLTVNQKESAEQVAEFFDEVGLTLPALLDSKGDVSVTYGAFFLPTTVIVGPDGIVAAVHRGMITRNALNGYLEQIDLTEGP